MGQGNPKLKGKTGNPLKKAKVKRGDQQKLRKGRVVIKPVIAKKQAEFNAQAALTKKIGRRIEQTMAARAHTDGGGLSVLKADGVQDLDGRTQYAAPVLSKGDSKMRKGGQHGKR